MADNKKETGGIPEKLQEILSASQTVTLKRSQIHPSDYNPREIGENERATLKKGLKNFGLIGGIVVNKQTGYTIVSGHQKVSILDEMAGYPENDYDLKVELIDVDEKTEIEINFFMNNPSAQGRWNEKKVKILLPQIDPKRAGFSNLDLAAFGVKIDVPQVNTMKEDIAQLQKPMEDLNEAEKEARAEAKKEAVKKVKEDMKATAESKADEADSFITLSFTSGQAKRDFLLRFGYGPDERFINGEVFSDMIERVN